MKPNILILSNPEDVHTFAIQEILERKGAKVSIFYGTDFPTKLYLTIFNKNEEVVVKHQQVNKSSSNEEYTAVWNRRPNRPVLPTDIEEEDREQAIKECNIIRDAYFKMLAPKALWANPHTEAMHTENKILQLKEFSLCGVPIPETLFTNNPDEIYLFIKKHKKVIYKPLSSQLGLFTSVITLEQLPERDILCLSPGIFQPLIDKQYELRITIIGNQIFPAKINSQGTKFGALDWRVDNGHVEVTFERSTLPEKIEKQCFAIMNKMGLNFGVIDMIVTPENEHVFLEINQGGQFLFLEELMDNPWPLGDAMAEMLLQGTPNYKWEENEKSIRCNDELFDVVKERMDKSKQFHQLPVR